jgi:hypothetical protein
MPERVPTPSKVDISSPHRMRAAVQNISNVYNATPEPVRKSGSEWYDRVHEATAKGIRGSGLDIHQGAGIVAAVSPQMDWEKNNIDALGELRHLNKSQWGDIIKGDRNPLQGMSISRAPQSALVKAHRIMHGDEDPYQVLNRQTAPKTNSFAHNIAEPDKREHVTIDGRAHDIAANRLQGWESDRGISSAALKSGKMSRYEHFESAYKGAAKAINMQHGTDHAPHEIQAITWEGGKRIEKAAPTKSGKPRKIGVRREGQPYV